MSKWKLAYALMTNERILINGVMCIIHALEREDGSGHCWNVKVDCGQPDTKWVFVRTVD